MANKVRLQSAWIFLGIYMNPNAKEESWCGAARDDIERRWLADNNGQIRRWRDDIRCDRRRRGQTHNKQPEKSSARIARQRIGADEISIRIKTIRGNGWPD